MYNRLLVALDQAETCELVFQKALSLAQPTSQVMLLHVLSETDRGPMMPHYPGLAYYPIINESAWETYRKEWKQYEESGLNRLRSFTDRATAAGVKAEFTQLLGNPGRAICELAQTWNADLVIVGSRGRRGLKELFLGSVSSYVMHHATCSVLVVHDDAIAQQTESAEDLAAARG
ncbi:universal stress protein [Romeria aff. gracilis LEGE 07310]|uniref:Universal stress protein n=1 Tax=Vasconcelosia minhoensis LEGE 07310 TaxID=915328 RepID=A0A8J7ATK4_9CYAN|nr:universal stress protein [Romeria gracilis]MBE9076278.1 universal stress protein [Romeria aff. gracilis LEGE 07310]